VNTESGFWSDPYLVRKSNKTQAQLSKHRQVLKNNLILSGSGIRLKKKKTTNIKDSHDLNITKNVTCKL
jgi:hypothetical protein